MHVELQLRSPTIITVKAVVILDTVALIICIKRDKRILSGCRKNDLQNLAVVLN